MTDPQPLPWVCTACLKEFANEPSLRRHERKIHGIYKTRGGG